MTLARIAALASVLVAGPAAAQDAQATARKLVVIASDGTRVTVGEVSGRIEVTPARSRRARFGAIRVHAGLELEARAVEDSELPVYAIGAIGGVLEVEESSNRVLVRALRRGGHGLEADLALGDTILTGVSITRRAIVVRGPAPITSTVTWAQANDGATQYVLRAGHVTLCASRGRRCVTAVAASPLPVRRMAERGRFVRVHARGEGVVLDAWVRASAVVEGAGGVGWSAGSAGPWSEGCPYEGRPAIVEGGSAVHLRPGGPVWARVPAAPESVYVHDADPSSDWVELTFAPGVQRAFPGRTCSTGWVRRAQVRWDVLRRGGITLALEEHDGRREVVVDSIDPARGAATHLRAGDVIVSRVSASGAGASDFAEHASPLENARRSIAAGGLHRIEREGALQTIGVPAGPGCAAQSGAQGGSRTP